jgi:Ca2+-binding EF-hand superfamily protein
MTEQVYEKFFEAQKALFDEWQKNMQASFKNFAPGGDQGEKISDFYKKAFESPQDFMKKIGESTEVYQSLFDLWKKLSEGGAKLDAKAAGEIYDEWSGRFFTLLHKAFVPSVPAFMQKFAEIFASKLESSNKVLSENYKNLSAADEQLRTAWFNSLDKGPKGYIDFLEVFRKVYDETTGKAAKAPTFGKDMDFWKRQQVVMDSYIKYNIASSRFYAALAEIAGDATRKALKDYVEMCSGDDNKSKTFEDFYKYWSKTVSAAYEKVLFSDEMSMMAGNMVDEMAKFHAEFDKFFELLFASLPIPKKSDMDDLYATVYELKKEVKALRKEIKNLTGPKS